eukprot:scaffold5289_cov107-Cylindrotheca_fusiformis.AAC.3
MVASAKPPEEVKELASCQLRQQGTGIILLLRIFDSNFFTTVMGHYVPLLCSKRTTERRSY